MPDYLCSFDIGTTEVKAGIFAPDGQMLAGSHREYEVSSPSPSWSEQSVKDMWRAQCEASRELFSRSRVPAREIAAVSVSCQRATFIPLNKDRRPLMNFIGWQDKRSVEQCEKIRSVIGNERFYQITGLEVDPTPAISKILWIKENAPHIYEQTSQFASTQNVHLKQLGVDDPPCDLTTAAYFGLLDVDNLLWSEELLTRLDIPLEKMPPLCASGKVAGKISAQAAEETGLAKGTQIVTAGGDLQCAGLGVGITEPGLVGVGIGSGADVLVYLDMPIRNIQAGLSCQPHVVNGAWEMEGISLSSGATYKWFRDSFFKAEADAARSGGLNPYSALDEAAAEVPAGSNGVMVLPCLSGAGAPNWDPMVRGVILGLTPHTNRNVLARAILEGVCLEIRWMLESVEQLGKQLKGIRIYGGPARSRLWNQIAANIYSQPITRMASNEAGLIGAAICSGMGVGIFTNAQEGAKSMVQVGEEISPNASTREMYDELFDIYKATYNALSTSGVQRRIARLGSCQA